MDKIAISSESIALSQLLKWANIVQSGGEAKHLIQSQTVTINGTIETRRNRKVIPGDIVTIQNSYCFQVTTDED